MGKPTQSLRFICRSCHQSLSRSTPQLRTYSNSAVRSNSIPNFQPTSSPELDALLLDWRQRVFTPAALNTTHQSLIFKKSRRTILENDPGVTVTMSDGEEVKLQPMNAFDKPNKMDSLAKIAKILSSTNETDVWSQLPTFLEGMRIARQHVPSWFLEKLTRKANEQGRAGVIKQCAAMYKKTGLSLSIRPVTRELFLGCHMRFMEAHLLEEDFEKEHKFAQSLAVMLDSKDHCGGTIRTSEHKADMRKDLTVTGVLLELAAARALSVHNGNDVEGLTGSFSHKLIALAGNDVLRGEEKVTPGHAIEDWVPISNGIRLALKVNGLVVGKSRNVDAEMRATLKKLQGQLDSAIQDASQQLKAESGGKPRRALQMLENLQQSSS